MGLITRPDVVQGLLSLFEAPRYMEIGVAKGVTFHKLIAAEKVAVDPEFRFDVNAAKRDNSNSTYIQATSDEYFGTIADQSLMFDVIYLDGLHTAEQTLRDFVNAISYLSSSGVIVIDDVKPNTHLASLPDRDNFVKVRKYLNSTAKSWMGDVYKVIYALDTFFQQFSYRTVEENHGQAIVWRKRRPQVTARSMEQIGRKTFESLVVENDILAITPYSAILDLIKRDYLLPNQE